MSHGQSSLSLYLASANPGKLREFRQAANARGIQVEPVPNFRDLPICIEDGATFEENARKKALHYGAATEGLVFADDSGICLDALGGAPGVYSARFSGPDSTDESNNQKMLNELHRLESGGPGTPTLVTQEKHTGKLTHRPINRAAHYVCVIALAERGHLLTVVEGRAHGLIIDEPRGSGGFGYDPYFFFPPLGKTFAELTPEAKFAVSHRGEAFRKLLDFLTL